MKRKDEKLLKSFRGLRPCELCGLWSYCQAHHVKPKGIGGGSELSHPLNLLSLCHLCHRRCHELTEGRFYSRAEQWDRVARREGYGSGMAVEEEVCRLLRQPKGSLSQ